MFSHRFVSWQSLAFFLMSYSVFATPILTEDTAINKASQLAVENDIALALVYGYPLTLYVQTFYPVIQDVGVNVPKNENNTATATSTSLVRPNSNYVYSPTAIDLSHDDVVLTVPEIGEGRSYVYAIYDLYGNNFANIGSVRNSPPGDYLLRPAGSRPAGLTMCDGSDTSGYKGIVDFATIYGSLEIRLLLRKNGTDLNIVHKYQRETKTKTVPRNGCPLAPALTESLLQHGALTKAALEPAGNFTPGNAANILDLLAKVAPYNPPQDRALIGEVDAMLARAGISNGTYKAKPYNLTAVNDIVLYNSSISVNPIEGHWKNFGHGWYQEHRNSSGDFHTDYITRANIAYIGYLELVYKQSLYPEYKGSLLNKQGLIHVAANESILFTFSSKPPSQMWSVTLYGADNLLIPNQLDRYNLAATSETLIYPNGTKVYPTGQHNSQYYLPADDGAPFQVLIQPGSVTPPSNWTGNWLPCQEKGGEFSVNFRTYGPSDLLTNGDYVFPVVTKQAAIKA